MRQAVVTLRSQQVQPAWLSRVSGLAVATVLFGTTIGTLCPASSSWSCWS